MNLETPSFEKEASKEKIVEFIKANGLENPEAKELLAGWINGEMEKAEASDPTPALRITIQVELAELLISAGEVVEGIEILLEQLDVAEEEGFRSTSNDPQCAKLFEEIFARLKSL